MHFVSLMIHDVDLATVCPDGHEFEVDGEAADRIFGNDVRHLVFDPIVHQLWLCFLCRAN